jgi:hypothetical protein
MPPLSIVGTDMMVRNNAKQQQTQQQQQQQQQRLQKVLQLHQQQQQQQQYNRQHRHAPRGNNLHHATWWSWDVYRHQNNSCGSGSTNSFSSSCSTSSRSIDSISKGTVLTKISEKQVRWVDTSGDDDIDENDDNVAAVNDNNIGDSHGKDKEESLSAPPPLLARVHDVLHFSDYTDDEWAQTWYSMDELKKILREATSIVRDYQHRQHARRHYPKRRLSSSSSSSCSSSSSSSSPSSSPSQRRYSNDTKNVVSSSDSNDGFLRGLEVYTTEGHQRIYNVRRIAQAAVLNEQYQYREIMRQRHEAFTKYGIWTPAAGAAAAGCGFPVTAADFRNHIANIYRYNTAGCQDDAVVRAQYDAFEAQKALSEMPNLDYGRRHSSTVEDEVDYERQIYDDDDEYDDDDDLSASSMTSNNCRINQMRNSFNCWPDFSQWLTPFQHKKDAFVECPSSVPPSST